jgi:hypothetical protein
MTLLLINCILCKNKEGHGLSNWGWWIQVIVREQRLWGVTSKQRVVLLDDLVVDRNNFQLTINSKHTLYDAVSTINGIIEYRHTIYVKSLLLSLFNYGGRYIFYTLCYNALVMFFFSRITQWFASTFHGFFKVQHRLEILSIFEYSPDLNETTF